MLYIILMCVFHFMSSALTYYLLCILHLFYTCEMMFDKKQIRVTFLFEVKMGH